MYFSLLLLILLAVKETLTIIYKCPCGYSGPCELDQKGYHIYYNCSVCSVIGRGLYKNCFDLYDHCESSPCARGRCVKTFGSYYCDCPQGFYGQNCDVTGEKFEHQIEKPMVIYELHNPKILYVIATRIGDNVTFRVEYSDGRKTRPFFSSFFPKEMRVLCLDRTSKNYKMDPHVCDPLPKRGLAHKLEPMFLNDDLKKNTCLKPLEKGITHNFCFQMNWVAVTASVNDTVLFSANYSVMTRYLGHSFCRFSVTLQGCSKDPSSPSVVNINTPSMISAWVRPQNENCLAYKVISLQWYRYSADIDQFYKVNRSESKKFLFLAPFTVVEEGPVFFDYEYTVMGNPPYYGGSTIVKIRSRCSKFLTAGELDLYPHGGKETSHPCHRPLHLYLESRNSNYLQSMMTFLWQCPQLNTTKITKVPDALYLRLQCGVQYNFNVSVTYSEKLAGCVLFNVTTVNTKIDIEIECFWNCFPTMMKDVPVLFIITASGQNLVEKYPLYSFSVFETGNEMKGSILENKHSPETIVSVLNATEFTTVIFLSKKIVNYISNVVTAATFKAKYGDAFAAVTLEIQIVPSTPICDIHEQKELNSSRVGMAKYFKLWSVTCNDTDESNFSYHLSMATEDSTETVRYGRNTEGRFSDIYITMPIIVIRKSNITGGLSSPIYINVKDHISPPTNTSVEIMFKIGDEAMDEGNMELALIIFALISFDAYADPIRSKKYSNDTRYDFGVKILLSLVKIKWLSNLSDIINALIIIRNIFQTVPFQGEERINKCGLDIIEVIYKSVVAQSSGIVILNTGYIFVDEIKIPFIEAVTAITVSSNVFHQKKTISGVIVQSNDVTELINFKTLEPQLELIFSFFKEFSVDTEYIYNASNTIITYKAGSRKMLFEYLMKMKYNAAMSKSSVTFTLEGLMSVKEEFVECIQTVIHKTVMTRGGLGMSVTPLLIVSLNGVPVVSRPVAVVPTPIDVYLRVIGNRSAFLVENIDEIIITTENVSFENYSPNNRLHKLSQPSNWNGNGSYFVQVTVHPNNKTDVSHQMIQVLWGLSEPPSRQECEAVKPSLSFSMIIPALNGKVNAYIVVFPLNNMSDGTSIKYTLSVVAAACSSYSNGMESTSCDVIDEIHDGEDIILHCRCYHLSAYTGEYIKPVHLKLTAYYIRKHYPRSFTVTCDYIHYALLSIFLIFTVCMIWARCLDRNRIHYRTTFPFDDNNEYDRVPYIVSVSTGKQVCSGTTSDVAIKVVGTKGESRVHMLKLKKYRTLETATDNWYIMYTRDHLGHLTHIFLWHNNKGCSPDWYCRHVTVFDIREMQRYRFRVHHWFTVGLNGYTRYAQIEGVRIQSAERYVQQTRNIFFYHYCNEFRNSHNTLSPFLKHKRSRMTYVQVTLIAFTFIMILATGSARAIYISGFYMDPMHKLHKFEVISMVVAFLWMYLIGSHVVARISFILFLNSKNDVNSTTQLNFIRKSRISFPDWNFTSKSSLRVIPDTDQSDFIKKKLRSSTGFDVHFENGAGKKNSSQRFKSASGTVDHSSADPAKRKRYHSSRSTLTEEEKRLLDQGMRWKIFRRHLKRLIGHLAQFDKVRTNIPRKHRSPSRHFLYFFAWALNILCLAGSFSYLGYLGTEYCVVAFRTWLVILVFMIAIDAVVVQPIFFFIRSLISLYLLQAANIEVSVLSSTMIPSIANKVNANIDSVTKIQRLTPPYKPLLTEKLIAMQKRSQTFAHLRQLLHYIFLLLIAILFAEYCFYYFTPISVGHLHESFYTSLHPLGVGLGEVRNISKFLDFCGSTLFPSLEMVMWYNRKPMAKSFNNYRRYSWPGVAARDFYHVQIGSPRLRMQFLDTNATEMIDDIFDEIWAEPAYGYWDIRNEFRTLRSTYHEAKSTEMSWHYTPPDSALSLTFSPKSMFTVYSAGGYLINLTKDSDANQVELLHWYHFLKDDRTLSAIFVDFNLMNVNDGSQTACTIFVEAHAEGFYDATLYMTRIFPWAIDDEYISRAVVSLILLVYIAVRLVFAVMKSQEWEEAQINYWEVAVAFASLLLLLFMMAYYLDDNMRYSEFPLLDEFIGLNTRVHLFCDMSSCALFFILCCTIASGVHNFLRPFNSDVALNIKIHAWIYLLLLYLHILVNEVVTQALFSKPVSFVWMPALSNGYYDHFQLATTLDNFSFCTYHLMFFTYKIFTFAAIAFTVCQWNEEVKNAQPGECSVLKTLVLEMLNLVQKKKTQPPKKSRISQKIIHTSESQLLLVQKSLAMKPKVKKLTILMTNPNS